METLNSLIDPLMQIWQQADTPFLMLFGVFFLLVWFLPSLLALLFNRKHAGKIAMLNIPAGLSWIAWGALCVWAVTGKLSASMAAKARLKPQS
ncbi:superinfection immunity protein [Rheinheimera sp. 4Y26]|uniref:superinfection immunity protein n=1 Tax=Rheinheimera sp. 4Y26 TaxID=2977811 RepID=UPI0021B0C964|nr:superinfection immunity protein [Rheinheimera sp. 4Y26]MCT6698050.1 superinfection immunity protein [Rheinheimera sp. 4Y26]